MEFIVTLHSVLSRSAVLFFALIGIWGVFRALRKNGVDGSYLGALVIGELIFIAQAILGVIMLIGGGSPARGVHFLYGVFALVALPGLFAYLKGDDSNQAQLYYAITTIFLAGVALRAIGTAV